MGRAGRGYVVVDLLVEGNVLGWRVVSGKNGRDIALVVIQTTNAARISLEPPPICFGWNTFKNLENGKKK